MTIKLGIVMDPIDNINLQKDTSLALMLAAQNKNWEVWYLEQQDIFFQEEVFGNAKLLRFNNNSLQYSIIEEQKIKLNELNVILMRKDPPVDATFLYTTYLLEKLQQQGVLVVNNPKSLCSFNEKIVATEFHNCIPPTLIAMRKDELVNFITKHQQVVLKPLDGMGGVSIFKLTDKDPNINVIIETITKNQQQQIMAQKFIPEITSGDKRIIVINGEPIPYALARIPKAGEFRGNLAAGAKGKGQKLTPQDLHIVEQISPFLKQNGIFFAGIDIIGNFLTEINITSPTGIREISSIFNIDIAKKILDNIEDLL